jgi:predicted DNA-binding transcriptional regulator AlpA
MINQKWYTYKEMQERTSLSRSTLWKLSKQEPFKKCFKKVGGAVRIDGEMFDRVFNTYEIQ